MSMSRSLSRMTAVFPLAALLLLAACGGGGGGGGGGGVTPPPAPVVVVSGAVQAPGGQVAFFRQQGPFERFAALFRSVAYAAVTGVSPVPDGTPVQLGRMTSIGTLSIMATTTTSGGRYSFNLTSAGLAFANDLIVQVNNPASGARMRAFVTTANVDITPVSESAVQVVLEGIASMPGASLANFTLQEIGDLVGAIDAMTGSNQMSAGLDINSTISSVKNATTNDPGIAAFLIAASAPGQTTEGPGDVGNFVPLAQGTTWVYQGTEQSGGQAPIPYSNTATISGTKSVGGVLTKVLSQSNPLNIGSPDEEYYTKDSRGLTYHGTNDATDVLSPQLVPYLTLRFPFGTGSTFEEINKKGLNFGEDVDGDSRNEKLDLVSIVAVKGFESVTVPAGTFTNCAKIETQTTYNVIVSSNGQTVPVQTTQTIWWAPGIGPVKQVLQIEDLILTEVLSSFTKVVPTSLTIGSPLPSHVERNIESSYSVDVVPGTAYTVSITGLTDTANLRVLGGVNECATSSPNASPKGCTVTASGSVLNIRVDGHQVIGSAANYVITAALAPVVTLPISGTGGSVPRGIPTIGLVGALQTNRYFATGLTPGAHTVSITGLTGDADLHVFSDETYSFELDCTLRKPGDVTNLPEDCTLTTGTAVYFSVASGELNRDGAGYVILVW